ncbi:MAG: folate-binding protein [Azoarcus sp.]|jgi:folate-binding protein YgfZ|nr:folate-binding protein [Azoarcus sp.]
MSSWTEYLARNGAKFAPEAFSVDFGAPYANADTLSNRAIAVPLLHLGLIQATGEEAGDFLHNLLSSDVTHLTADAAQWTSFSSAQGRMLANFLLWHGDEGYTLALAADLAPALLEKLSFYVLRTKVKPAIPATEHTLIGLAGPAAARCLQHAQLPSPESDMTLATGGGLRVIRIAPRMFVLDVAAEDAPAAFDALCNAGATGSGTPSWRLAAIRAGLPLVTTATKEAFVAQMLNYDLIGGISFTKGCYPGQEIIARTQHLGKTKRRMYRIGFSTHLAGFAPGVPLFSPEFDLLPVGSIVGYAPLLDGAEALAVLKTECIEAGVEIHASVPDGPRAELLELPYEIPA